MLPRETFAKGRGLYVRKDHGFTGISATDVDDHYTAVPHDAAIKRSEFTFKNRFSSIFSFYLSLF